MIDEAIATVQQALQDGKIGYMGLYSHDQMNYHAMWAELVEYVAALSNEKFHDPIVFALRMKVLEIADKKGGTVPIFAVNTLNPTLDKQYEGLNHA